MLIGIDFDNTLAGYDSVFAAVACEMGLLDQGRDYSKTDVRNALRSQGDDGEHDWQRLQGQVYGKYMGQAEMINGTEEFLSTCRDKGETVFIVSHKTEFGHHDPSRVNLREAALAWMTDKGFFDADGFAIPRENVFFEATQGQKIDRIKALRCTHFIDDLEEIFGDPEFPATTRTFLVRDANSWHTITEAVFDA